MSTPDEIAETIVSSDVGPIQTTRMIAAAIRTEREARERAEALLATVLDRESATTKRYDEKLERTEALLKKSDAGWEAEAGKRLEAEKRAERAESKLAACKEDRCAACRAKEPMP